MYGKRRKDIEIDESKDVWNHESCKLNSWVLGKTRIHGKDIENLLDVVTDLCKRLKVIEEGITYLENRDSFVRQPNPYCYSDLSFMDDCSRSSVDFAAEESARYIDPLSNTDVMVPAEDAASMLATHMVVGSDVVGGTAVYLLRAKEAVDIPFVRAAESSSVDLARVSEGVEDPMVQAAESTHAQTFPWYDELMAAHDTSQALPFGDDVQESVEVPFELSAEYTAENEERKVSVPMVQAAKSKEQLVRGCEKAAEVSLFEGEFEEMFSYFDDEFVGEKLKITSKEDFDIADEDDKKKIKDVEKILISAGSEFRSKVGAVSSCGVSCRISSWQQRTWRARCLPMPQLGWDVLDDVQQDAMDEVETLEAIRDSLVHADGNGLLLTIGLYLKGQGYDECDFDLKEFASQAAIHMWPLRETLTIEEIYDFLCSQARACSVLE